VEGDGHDPVCQIEGLLDAVAVVDVDVDVEDPFEWLVEGRGGRWSRRRKRKGERVRKQRRWLEGRKKKEKKR
jgi:hypothetical protein